MPNSIGDSGLDHSFELEADVEEESPAAAESAAPAEFQEGSSSGAQLPAYAAGIVGQLGTNPLGTGSQEERPTYRQAVHGTIPQSTTTSAVLAGLRRRVGYAKVAVGVSSPNQQQLDHELRQAVDTLRKPLDDPDENPSGLAVVNLIREHRARSAPQRREARITEALRKGANPATPSESGQNAFHKLASALNPSQELTDLLIAGTSPRESLKTAARAQDKKLGNTPIHDAEYNRGLAIAQRDSTAAHNLQYLIDQLTEAATPATRRTLDLPVQDLRNKAGKTPGEMYQLGVEDGRQEPEHDDFSAW
jgi:hypothetical protein